jgi:GNAT superfamily N-acetyltransferase
MHPPSSAPPPDVTIRLESCSGEGPQWVVAQAEEELVVRYGFLGDGELGLSPATFERPRGAFLVARASASMMLLGGVGVRTMDEGTGEVKRLWVTPAWRGRGVGRALMDALEHTARHRLGLTALELATGDRQPEAVALYEATGWRRVPVDADGRPLPVWHIRFVKPLLPRRGDLIQ